MPAGFDDVAFTVSIGPIESEYANGEICLDSCWFPSYGQWMWSSKNIGYVFPTWDGPHCFTIDTGLVDSDSDGLVDLVDNCPADYNPLQEDLDTDGIGDICDTCLDLDGDGFGNPEYTGNDCPDDNCPTVSNPSQSDSDGDGIGDACTWDEFTWDGTDVDIDFGSLGVTVTFDEVLSYGMTELTITTIGPAPESFDITPAEPPIYYGISTDASYVGSIEICFDYDDSLMSDDVEQSLTIQHHDGATWSDITSSVDTSANEVCGVTSSLSTFVLALPLGHLCGDIDGSGEGPDIADLVYLVTYMFQSGPEPPALAACDVNGDSVGPDIADLVYLVTYMFQNGPAPQCP